MSEQVRRYCMDQTGCEIEDPDGVFVRADDYAILQAECASLKNSLLAITTRHFAERWKQTSKDSELEQYLSAGIAQLEEERDAALAECDRLRADVLSHRNLCAAMYQAAGAYDMPERILEALIKAAVGKPFAHVIDGLLPCVPLVDHDVQSLVEALEGMLEYFPEGASDGECFAVDAARTTLSAIGLGLKAK